MQARAQPVDGSRRGAVLLDFVEQGADVRRVDLAKAEGRDPVRLDVLCEAHLFALEARRWATFLQPPVDEFDEEVGSGIEEGER